LGFLRVHAEEDVNWNFDTVVPTFEYADGSKPVTIGNKTAQVNFSSTVRTNSEEAYHIQLYDSRTEPTTEQLELAFSEVTLTVERLAEIVEQTNRIEYIAIASPPAEDEENLMGHTDTDQSVEPGLSIRVSYSTPRWREDSDGFYTRYRFDHVAQLRTQTETVPVDIQTTRFPEEGANPPEDDPVIAGGTWLHTSEFLADATAVKKIDCRNRLANLDLTELLHNSQSSPTKPPME
jgi:hypothetical protein